MRNFMFYHLKRENETAKFGSSQRAVWRNDGSTPADTFVGI
jgi:hypothetical protein